MLKSQDWSKKKYSTKENSRSNFYQIEVNKIFFFLDLKKNNKTEQTLNKTLAEKKQENKEIKFVTHAIGGGNGGPRESLLKKKHIGTDIDSSMVKMTIENKKCVERYSPLSDKLYPKCFFSCCFC